MLILGIREHTLSKIVTVWEKHTRLKDNGKGPYLIVLLLSWFVLFIEEDKDWVGYTKYISSVDGAD
jgi:hypothetical protein